jgi:hypothetical protein
VEFVSANRRRDWSPDVTGLARAAFDAPSGTIQKVRNFKYRSDSNYEQRWETRTYDLARIRRIDLFPSFCRPTQSRLQWRVAV